MKVIICYDVSDNRLRSTLAKYLERFANRVQESVFVAELGVKQVLKMKEATKKLLAEEATASCIYLHIEDSVINDDITHLLPSRVAIV